MYIVTLTHYDLERNTLMCPLTVTTSTLCSLYLGLLQQSPIPNPQSPVLLVDLSISRSFDLLIFDLLISRCFASDSTLFLSRFLIHIPYSNSVRPVLLIYLYLKPILCSSCILLVFTFPFLVLLCSFLSSIVLLFHCSLVLVLVLVHNSVSK